MDAMSEEAPVTTHLTIKLFATFQRGRFTLETREFAEPPTVAEIVDGLAIPRAEVGVMLVNGSHVEFDDRPADGSTVAIFPVIGGG